MWNACYSDDLKNIYSLFFFCIYVIMKTENYGNLFNTLILWWQLEGRRREAALQQQWTLQNRVCALEIVLSLSSWKRYYYDNFLSSAVDIC